MQVVERQVIETKGRMLMRNVMKEPHLEQVSVPEGERSAFVSHVATCQVE